MRNAIISLLSTIILATLSHVASHVILYSRSDERRSPAPLAPLAPLAPRHCPRRRARASLARRATRVVSCTRLRILEQNYICHIFTKRATQPERTNINQ